MRRALAILIGLTIAAAATGSTTRADSAASRNNEGNRLYEQKQFDEALRLYTDAQVSRPEAPELHYNIGNVLYRKGEYDKAIGEYRRAESARDAALSQAATFNRGNALMLSGRLQDAANAYIQALRADPSDGDAKRNLELALRLLAEERKRQQQNEQNEGREPPDPSPQSGPQPPGGGEEPQKRPPQPRPGQMTEEDARRILDALREDERQGVKKHARATAPNQKHPEKDW